MPKFQDLTGQKFHMWTVLKQAQSSKRGLIKWLCKCDCGTEKSILVSDLNRGKSKSCGCYRKQLLTKHGKIGTRLYKIWEDMKSRCQNKNNKLYKHYGMRGIKICDEWINDFMVFYNWSIDNGYADNLEIDRINVNGNYEPSNCRWATESVQSFNKRLNPKTNTGYIGVYFVKNKEIAYISRIGANNKNIYLGSFKTKEEAIEARKQAELKYYGV